MAAWHVQRMGPPEWQRVQALRMRALAGAPEAFGTRLEEEIARPPAAWQERLADRRFATFLASAGRRDIGMAAGAPYEGAAACAGLFGMWVAPPERGKGVGDALVDAVVAWARAEGYARVLLDVANMNATATRLYARKGFRRNGVTGSLPPPREHILEHQRALEL